MLLDLVQPFLLAEMSLELSGSWNPAPFRAKYEFNNSLARDLGQYSIIIEPY